MTHPMALQNFESRVNQTFQVQTPQGVVKLTLGEVLPQKKAPKHYESYSLLFQGPSDIFLEQAIYRLEHDEMDPVDLFLVPTAGDDAGYDYEVVVNRKCDTP